MPVRPLAWPIAKAIEKAGIAPSPLILTVSVTDQAMTVLEQALPGKPDAARPGYRLRSTHVISTSAFGIGQQEGSNHTPLGLHRIAERIGGGLPRGTVFKGRKPIGSNWKDHPNAKILHRILRLDGLEPGFNRGGSVDSFNRYIYIHGFPDESTLGSPASHGCIHMAARDLIPLYDLTPVGTLVWIAND